MGDVFCYNWMKLQTGYQESLSYKTLISVKFPFCELIQAYTPWSKGTNSFWVRGAPVDKRNKVPKLKDLREDKLSLKTDAQHSWQGVLLPKHQAGQSLTSLALSTPQAHRSRTLGVFKPFLNHNNKMTLDSVTLTIKRDNNSERADIMERRGRN